MTTKPAAYYPFDIEITTGFNEQEYAQIMQRWHEDRIAQPGIWDNFSLWLGSFVITQFKMDLAYKRHITEITQMSMPLADPMESFPSWLELPEELQP